MPRFVQVMSGLASRVFLAVWIPLMLVIGGTLMAGHWYTLPRPDDQVAVARSLNELRTDAERDSWLAVHVLYSQCRCSQRVLDEVFSRARPDGAAEKLILVGHHEEFEARAAVAGLDTLVLEPRELSERFHIESAPLFVAIAPSGDIRYMGGYTARKQGPNIMDREILENLMHEDDVAELPLFGCAVSKELQGILDPLGIKYAQDSE